MSLQSTKEMKIGQSESFLGDTSTDANESTLSRSQSQQSLTSKVSGIDEKVEITDGMK